MLFRSVLNELDNDTAEFDLAKEMFVKVQNMSGVESKKDSLNPLIRPLLTFMGKRLDNIMNRDRIAFDSTHSLDLTRMNSFLSDCTFMKSYNNNNFINVLINKNTWVLNEVLKSILNKQYDSTDVSAINFSNSIHLLIALAPSTDFGYYVKKMSPFEFRSEERRVGKECRL